MPSAAMELFIGGKVVPWVGVPAEIENALDRLYRSGASGVGELAKSTTTGEEAQTEKDVARLRDLASEAPVIRMVNLLIGNASELRASDIHIEPFERRLRVRYRVDGVLREVDAPPQRLQAAVISRIKIMANLNIAERRLPQDGRIKMTIRGKDIDMRHIDHSHPARGKRGHAPSRSWRGQAFLTGPGVHGTGSIAGSRTFFIDPTASCSSPGRPAAAKRRRSMPACWS